MKKKNPFLFLLSASVLAMSSLLSSRASEPQRASAISAQAAQKAVGASSRAVLQALKKRDMTQLSRYVHPQLGLRFLPYPAVGKQGRVFSARQVKRLSRDKTRYLWGNHAGSGHPIRLTWNEYSFQVKRFVWPLDYTSVTQVRYGNHTSFSASQLKRFYPRAILVQFHSPGREPKYGGMDWRSLWLVWNRSGKTWKLVGIANDEWTP